MTQNQQRDITKKCHQCKQMFGHPNFDDLCSLCYKIKTKSSQSLQQSNLKKQLINSEKTIIEKNNQKEEQKSEYFKEKKEKNQSKEQQQQFSTQKNKSNINQIKQQQIQSYQSNKRSNKEGKKVEKIKCFKCDKKTGLLGFQCHHCEMNYCKRHRLPEDHKCQVDFVALGKQKLISENPEIKKNQLQNNQKL